MSPRRAKFGECGLDIDDPKNGMWLLSKAGKDAGLPGPAHFITYTTQHIAMVDGLVAESTCDGLPATLEMIKDVIRNTQSQRYGQ